MSKKLDGIKDVKVTFEEYFKEDLDAIEEELTQSKKYSDIIDNEIDKLSTPSLGSNKGSQHYLIEHINNAVALQTQRQGLRKDRFAIKKAIMDYAAKFADNQDSNSEENLTELINKLLEKDKKDLKTNIISEPDSTEDEDLDSAIDNILEEK